MPDDFKDHPVSLAEHRAKSQHSGNLWSPRDVLIDTLRDIDAGTLKPTALIICIAGVDEDGDCTTGFRQCGTDVHQALGLLERVKWKIQE